MNNNHPGGPPAPSGFSGLLKNKKKTSITGIPSHGNTNQLLTGWPVDLADWFALLTCWQVDLVDMFNLVDMLTGGPSSHDNLLDMLTLPTELNMLTRSFCEESHAVAFDQQVNMSTSKQFNMSTCHRSTCHRSTCQYVIKVNMSTSPTCQHVSKVNMSTGSACQQA